MDEQTEQVQAPSFTVNSDLVLEFLRSTHPDLVEAASWRVAALQAAAERDQARAELAALQGATEPTA